MSVRSLVDGVPGAAIAVDDRGLHYGDGLFETIACRDGRPRHLGLHHARLARGCTGLGIAAPGRELLEEELLRLLAGVGRAIAKVIVTRGRATARGYRPAGDERPTRLCSVHAWPPAPAAPWRVGTSPVRLGSQPLLAGLKHLNRLEQVLAQRALAEAGLDEAVMLDANGDAVCGTSANLYVKLDGAWFTPPIVDCGVAGVTRARLLAGAGGEGFRPVERRIGPADLAAAESMAFSNVRLGLQAVHWHAGRELPPDPSVARAQVVLDAS